MEQDTAYPGWAPNPDSAVVRLAQEVLTEVTGHKVKVGFPSRAALSPESAVASWSAADPASSQEVAAALCRLFHCDIFAMTGAFVWHYDTASTSMMHSLSQLGFCARRWGPSMQAWSAESSWRRCPAWTRCPTAPPSRARTAPTSAWRSPQSRRSGRPRSRSWAGWLPVGRNRNTAAHCAACLDTAGLRRPAATQAQCLCRSALMRGIALVVCHSDRGGHFDTS